MQLDESVTLAISYLESKKLDAFEIFHLKKEQFLVDAKAGRIEAVNESEEIGLAVRVVDDARLGFSYTTSADADAIKACVDAAVQGARVVDPDPAWSVAEAQPITSFGWCHDDERFKTMPVSEKLDRALMLESSALKTDPRIKRVKHASYGEERVKVGLVNSCGVDLSYRRTMATSEVVAVAESDHDSQWAIDLGFSHTTDGLDIASVGMGAAREALSLLGAKSISTMRTKACLKPYVAAHLLKVLGKGFYADNVCKKKSAIGDKLGKSIYSPSVTIVDDGLYEGGYASFPFDGEGEPQKRTILVENGVISNWLSDIYWARKLGVPPTGSSRREFIRDIPLISMSNLYIEPGRLKSEELLGELETGFYVTDVIGVHTINPITGDYSVGAVGQWVEKGETIHPVKGVVISGNLHELFKRVTHLGNDLRFVGNVGAPSVIVSHIQVSG